MPAPKIAKLLLLLVVSVAATAVLAYRTIIDVGRLKWLDWAYTELLIDYSAGFVRRGAVGHVLRVLAPNEHGLRATVNVAVFAWTFALVLVTTLLLARVVDRFTFIELLVVLIAPGFLFTSILTNVFYFRKETLFHLGTALNVALLLLIRERPRSRRGLVTWLFLSSLLLQLAVFPLVHEGYVLISFAVSGFLFREWAKVAERPWKMLACAMVVEQVVAFAMCAVHHGTRMQAMRIWDSFPLDQLPVHADAATAFAGPHGADGMAIQAVGWTLDEGLALPRIAFASQFDRTMWLFALALCVAQVFAIAVFQGSLRARFLSLSLLTFLPTLPLFVLGWDWGRWLACGLVNSTFLLVYLKGAAPAEPPATEGGGAGAVPRLRLETAIGPARRRWRAAAFVVVLASCYANRLTEACVCAQPYERYNFIVPSLCGIVHARAPGSVCAVW